LRTPLTPLKLQIQLLQRLLSSTQFAEQERVTRLLESSERSVTRLARLVNDLLEATSIAENKLALRNEEFDLVELAREIVGQLSEALRHAHCPVEIEAAGPLVGHGDRFRLEQVLVNLISNAMKYGANKPIRISITQKDGRALLKVSDQGIGISKTDQEQIFGRFERGSAPEQSSGLGLGLYISRAIVEQHRGKISVTSEPGAGSTFQVELPL
jgi:signal transduction histidine kinase